MLVFGTCKFVIASHIVPKLNGKALLLCQKKMKNKFINHVPDFKGI